MKFFILFRRCCLPMIALLAAAGVLHAQTPDVSPTPGKPPHAALENELAMYSPFESPWAEIRSNHAFETRLFNLLRAEVRLWRLQNQLGTPQDHPAREGADEIARIIHAQILSQAAEALPLLQKTPNKPFAALLVRQLEAYPYEWQEEGSEELLPSLHKLIDPPAGKPTPEAGPRRKRKRVSDGNG